MLAAGWLVALVPILAPAAVGPAPAPPAPAVAPATAPPSPAAPRVRAKSAPLVPISTPPPSYPDHARRARISGYVVVTYTIGTDGRVGNVRVVESSPHGVFEHEVEATLARWRYEPPASPREVTHTFDFEQ
jgi:protein TonB